MSEENDSTPPPMDDAVPSQEPADAPPPMDTPPPMKEGGLPLPGQGQLSEKDDRTFGMLAHLLGIFTGFVGPLIIWLIKKEESPFVDDQGKEALNFQIVMSAGYIISSFLLSILVGCLTYPAFIIASIVFGILATMKANEGTAYRYPFTIRIIK